MLSDKQRAEIIDFYGNQLQQTGSKYRLFLLERSIGYVAIGDEYDYMDLEPVDLDAVEFYPNALGTVRGWKAKGLPNTVRLKRLDLNTVPKLVIESFDRHIWYSRWCLIDIRVVKFDIDGYKTFGIYLEGYLDDGWDADIYAWEVYEANGNFISSVFSWNSRWICKDRLINHEDLRMGGIGLPPPPYNPETASQSLPIWIERAGLWMLPIWSEDEIEIIG